MLLVVGRVTAVALSPAAGDGGGCGGGDGSA